jgi:cytochrome c oxidase subunit 2
MLFAVVLILLVVGSILFHLLSPWYFTELASNWGMVDLTMDITFYVTGFVFVTVNLFMAYCVIKFRYKKGARSTYEPENKKLEYWLTGLTAVGVAAMLTPGLFVWAKFVDVPEDAHVVEAVGQQWHWTFRYPGEDGKLGEADAERISSDNPFGIDPEDPNSQDDVIVYNPEAHVPIDQPVKFLLRSKDVLHNFTVAQFRVKMDLVPGMNTFMWLTPTKTGRYELLCEELCGVGHFAMRGAVVVDEAADFDTWLSEQPTFAEQNARPAGDAAVGSAQYAVCAACHGQQGEGIPAMNAPKIAGQSEWYLKRQISSYKDGLRGVHEADIFGQQMIGMVATLADESAIDNVVAHIQTLPDNDSAATVEGDVESGQKLYTTCAYCHGGDGMGRQALNAPRIARSSDWYLARQLQNFKTGVRGSHPQDYYGYQMGLLSQTLHDEQAINDIIAYINTL